MDVSQTIKNQRGQGALEYILILCITVILIMSFVWQFSGAFRKYAENFFGEYIMCLMETGELPGQTGGQCAAQYVAFDIKNGKTTSGGDATAGGGSSGGLTGAGTGANGTGANGSDNGKNGDGKNGKNSSNKSASTSSSSSSGSGSSGGSGGELGSNSGAGSGAFGRTKNTSGKTRVGSASQVGADGDAGKGKEGLRPIGTNSSTTSESYGNRGGRRTAMGRDFSFDGQKDEEKRTEERPTTKAVAQNVGDRLKPISAVEKQERKPAAAPDNDSGFTIGGFLRIMIIAGIVIAIFILFGGQLLAISKGGEK